MIPERQLVLGQLAKIAETDTADSVGVRKGALSMEALLLQGKALGDVDVTAELGETTLRRLQQLYEVYETDLEYDFASQVLGDKAASETEYSLYTRFRRLIQAEVDLAGVNPSDRVLFIGSGPFPISAILYSKLAPVSVVCFDKSPEATETSQQVLQRLGFADGVNVLNASGEDGSVYGYDVISVALLAQPKGRIMDNIWHHAPSDVRVICRTSEEARQAFYRGTQLQQLTAYRHFRLEDHYEASGDNTISSLYLKIGREADTR